MKSHHKVGIFELDFEENVVYQIDNCRQRDEHTKSKKNKLQPIWLHV